MLNFSGIYSQKNVAESVNNSLIPEKVSKIGSRKGILNPQVEF